MGGARRSSWVRRAEARPRIALASVVVACAAVTMGCRDTVLSGAPTPAKEASAPSAGPPASATPIAEELTIAPGGCWGDGRGSPDTLLQRAEERCAGGMVRAAGPADLTAPVKLGGEGHACHRVAIVGRGRVVATLTDGTGFILSAEGDSAVLLPKDGPLCVAGELTLAAPGAGSARFAAWRGGP